MDKIVGYNFKCSGLKECGFNVEGRTLNECLRKFRIYWENDYDVDTENPTATPIVIDFDIYDDESDEF